MNNKWKQFLKHTENGNWECKRCSREDKPNFLFVLFGFVSTDSSSDDALEAFDLAGVLTKAGVGKVGSDPEPLEYLFADSFIFICWEMFGATEGIRICGLDWVWFGEEPPFSYAGLDGLLVTFRLSPEGLMTMSSWRWDCFWELLLIFFGLLDLSTLPSFLPWVKLFEAFVMVWPRWRASLFWVSSSFFSASSSCRSSL